jgi:hypothetical protein
MFIWIEIVSSGGGKEDRERQKEEDRWRKKLHFTSNIQNHSYMDHKPLKNFLEIVQP